MPSFSDMIGQSRSIRILRAFLTKADIPQSLLFEGEPGLGKRKIAEIFAAAVLCQSNISADDRGQIEACGHCLACQKMSGQNHPDFSVLVPDGNAIKIDQIRKIQEALVYKPVDVIIDPAEKMNAAAANALLKTLEEPPPYALLILVSGKSGMLLPTLRSRCQKLGFHPLSFSQVVSALVAAKGCSNADAHFLVAMANGRLQEAMALEMDAAREMEAAYHTLVSNEDLFEIAARFSGSTDVFEPALLYLTTWLRDVLVLKSCANESDPALLRYAWRQDEMRVWGDAFERFEISGFLADLQQIHVAQTAPRSLHMRF